MPYTPTYEKPYEYKDDDPDTPVDAQAMNDVADTLTRVEAFLAALQIPEKLSELVNDEGFIQNTVSNLANYYLKTETYDRAETYTREEVQALIADAISKVSGKLNISIVDALPTSEISTTTFYLVPKETSEENNIYDEYINTDGTADGWEFIGGVSTSIDMSNYYTKEEVDAMVPDFANKETLDKFSENEKGKLLWNGEQIEGGGTELPDNIVLSMLEEEEPVELPTCEDLPFKFGIDADGNYGYYKVGADTVTPFSSGGGGISYSALNLISIQQYTLIEEV